MPRRPNGAGTYRVRPSGLVELRLFIAGRQRSYYGSSSDECDRRAAADRVRYAIGLDMSNPNRTLAEYLGSWIASKRAPLDPATWTRYEGIVRLQIIPHLGHHRLMRLMPEHVEEMLGELATTLSPRSVHHVRAVLRTALNRALARGYVLRNSAALAEGPDLRRGKGRTWTPPQVSRLLTAIAGDRYENVYRVALAVTLRQGEVLGLRLPDLDLTAGSARVEGQVRLRRWKDRAKTEESQRLATLPPLALRAIKAELAAQAQRRFLMRDGWRNGDELVFTTDSGRPLDGTAVTKRLKRICREADLPWLTFHGLRHTASSLMHSLGVDAKTRAAILGHADERTTDAIYTHTLPETIHDAMGRYDALLTTLDLAAN